MHLAPSRLASGFSLVLFVASVAGQRPGPEVAAAAPQHAACRFVPNRGQWDRDAAFCIQRGAATAWLDGSGICIEVHNRVPASAGELDADEGPGPWFGSPCRTAQATLGLTFVGSLASAPVAGEATETKASYFLGIDASRWKSGLPTYEDVVWQAVRPGVDVRARTHATGLLEYVLEFAPGVDAASIELQWTGADSIRLDAGGGLRLAAAESELLQSAPIAWQPLVDGTRLPVTVQIELVDAGRFRFRVDGARADLPIVIDPVLTYLGQNDAGGHGVARDVQGRVYVAGYTSTGGNVGRDVLLSCIDAGTTPPAVLWTTTVGGADEDVAFDVDVDASGFLVMAGYTLSANFPTMNAAQAAHGGGQLDGYVTTLLLNGANPPTMMQSTYLGGSGNDWCCRVNLDGLLQATVAGSTNSTTGFPVVNAIQPALAGGFDAFVTRLPATGGSWSYSTYHGGNGNENSLPANWQTLLPGNIRIFGLDLDASGRVLIVGNTTSTNYPTQNPYQAARSGPSDVFATILDPSQVGAAQRVWSTHLGGSAQDWGMTGAFGPGDEVVLGGCSVSSNYPTTGGALQTTFVFDCEAIVTWLDRSQTGAAQLRYSTFFGGPQGDVVWSLAVDGRGHATVGGHCGDYLPNSVSWPNDAGGFQLNHGGDQDGWLARLRPDGQGRRDLTFGTYLGGTGGDVVLDLDLEPDGGVVVAGQSNSPSIPSVSGSLLGTNDAFGGTVEMLPQIFTRDVACRATACAETMFLEVDRLPVPGAAFELLVGGAPPNAIGVLAFGAAMPCAPVFGGLLGVNPSVGVSPILVSSPLGAASLPIVLPPTFPVPIGVDIQALWFATAGCAAPLTMVSSATLR